MEQGITKGDVLQRLGGIGFIIGGILTLVFSALEPRPDDPANTQQALSRLAENEGLSTIVFLGLAVGIWAIMIGSAAVYRSIATGGAAAWARLGFYGVIVGTTIFTITLAVGWATTGAAAASGGTQPGTPAYTIAAALHMVGNSTFFMTIIVNWLALAFLGIGMILSTVYPKWMGWVLLILGVLIVVVVGIPQAVGDPSQTLGLVFAVLAGLTSIWAIVVGIWVTRRA
jgi:hypothetical protein